MANWREKVKLISVLSDTIDGRSTNELRRAVRRLFAKKEMAGKAAILNGYLQLLDMAASIAPGMLQSASDDHLEKVLRVLEKEGVVAPSSLQEALVKRKVSSLVSTQSWTELLCTIEPWTTDLPWDSRSPRLGSLEMAKKVAAFNKMWFTDTMIPHILQGETSVDHIALLCEESLKCFAELDMLEKTASEASAHEQACCIWRALLAIINHTFDDENQDPCP